MKKLLALSAIACSVLAPSVMAAEEVNVYSYRQPFLIEPMFKEFTQETGIKVNVKFAKEGIAEKLAQEGEYSPADVILTSEFSRLFELSDKGLTQPVNSRVIDENIPAQYRDSSEEWFALTVRTRSVYSSRDRVGKLGDDFDYLDLAKPEYKGKICTRSGKHPYNIALVAAMIANHGEAQTKTWLEGLKANLARKPQGNDRDQVRAIKEGLVRSVSGQQLLPRQNAGRQRAKELGGIGIYQLPGSECSGYSRQRQWYGNGEIRTKP